MATDYTQSNRLLRLTTPLGKDKLLLANLSVREGISQLFDIQVEALAKNSDDVAFDKLLGQKVSVELVMGQGKSRFWNGIVYRVAQSGRDQVFTTYRLELTPQFWLLTKKHQSRIFQQKSVPDILKAVLQGVDVSWEIQGTFQPREICVQYRETDYNFASRLMEEEGIYYFFKHSSDGHKMVVANTPGSHPDVPNGSKAIYESVIGGAREDMRIYSWDKVQELRSGKVTLWDHCFELPHKHLEAEQKIKDSVQAGTVTHKQAVNNDKLEIYDWPGRYAQRFDGVDKGGGDNPSDLQKIFEDNKRTTGIRMDQETVGGLLIQGSSNCRQFCTGHKFTIERHFNANGPYVLTEMTHTGRQSPYSSGGDGAFEYANSFTCIPSAQPYRPQQIARKPIISGTQTAVVVGPAGEEIFTDKYGRVKVQFHWDRDGKNNADSSCWVRVAQVWAGKRWGASFWPRIGQEVIVAFAEGDPDQPIIVGSVYNADQMPPYLGKGPDDKHPNDNKVSGIKTNTTQGGQGFNELRFDDTKDKQQVFIHAERNMDVRVKNDNMEWILGNRNLIVGTKDKPKDQREQVSQDKHMNVKRHQVEKIEGNTQLLIGKGDASDGGNSDISIEKKKTETIGGDFDLHVQKNRNVQIETKDSLTVNGEQHVKVSQNHAMEAGQAIHIKAGMTLVLEAGMQLSLKVGGNFIDIGPAGVSIVGTMVMINSGGAAGSGPDASPTAPQDAKEAKPTKPDEADNAKTGQKSAP